jgi:hypothetical protein
MKSLKVHRFSFEEEFRGPSYALEKSLCGESASAALHFAFFPSFLFYSLLSL